MRFARILAPAFVLAALATGPLLAQQAAPSKDDVAAIAACLKEVDAEYDKYEKLSEQARQKAEEPSDASSCIGTVSSVCQEKITGDENKGLASCNGRETAVWQQIMESRVAAYIKEAKPNEAEAMKKVQAAWTAYRDARCNYAAIDNTDAAAAAALTSACMLEQTASQALWIDSREN